MQVTPLAVLGAVAFTPRQHPDGRGLFLEWFRADVLSDAIGHRLTLAQANHSVSARGTLRGVHYADVPPGQAKYVYCPSGAVLDVVVDLRVGSPTFGAHDAVQLDEVDRRGVYLPEGVGHAFLALTNGAAVTYLCSTAYTPAAEHGVQPLDPGLDIAWPEPGPGPLLLSDKDRTAPTLAEASASGVLPSYQDCLHRYDELAGRS